MKCSKMIITAAIGAACAFSGSAIAEGTADAESYISSLSLSQLKTGALKRQADVERRVLELDLDKAGDAQINALAREYLTAQSCLARAYMAQGEDPSFMVKSRTLTSKTFSDDAKMKQLHRFLAHTEGQAVLKGADGSCR